MDEQQRRAWVLPARTGRHQDLDLKYLDPDNEDERRILIEAEHPEYADALAAGVEVMVDGHPMAPAMHVSVHEIVTNQILDNTPPETWATAQRLSDLGYDRHEILHMLGQPVTKQMWRAMHEGEPFDRDGFVADLAALPETWEAERQEAEATRPARRSTRPSPWIGGSD